MSQRHRSWVRLDQYAIFDVAREHRLSANEAWLLEVLVRLANWQTAEYAGTLADLAEHSRFSRNTVRTVFARLVDAGLVVALTPFGPNGLGRVWIECYGTLVMPSRSRGTAQNSANQESNTRAAIAQDTRGTRSTTAQNSANLVAVTSDDAPSRGREEGRMSGVTPELPGGVQRCASVWRDAEGNPKQCENDANGKASSDGTAFCAMCEPF